MNLDMVMCCEPPTADRTRVDLVLCLAQIPASFVRKATWGYLGWDHNTTDGSQTSCVLCIPIRALCGSSPVFAGLLLSHCLIG